MQIIDDRQLIKNSYQKRKEHIIWSINRRGKGFGNIPSECVGIGVDIHHRGGIISGLFRPDVDEYDLDVVNQIITELANEGHILTFVKRFLNAAHNYTYVYRYHTDYSKIKA